MTAFLLMLALLISVPLAAQTRVLTNADLHKPITWSATVAPEVLRGIVGRQFIGVPKTLGPQVSIAGRSNNLSGPWDWPILQPSRRLDGSLFTDPPWVAMAYDPYPYGAPPWVVQNWRLAALNFPGSARGPGPRPTSRQRLLSGPGKGS